MADPAKRTPWSQVSLDTAVLLLVGQQEGLFSRIHEPQQTRANLMADNAHPKAGEIYATLPAGLVPANGDPRAQRTRP